MSSHEVERKARQYQVVPSRLLPKLLSRYPDSPSHARSRLQEYSVTPSSSFEFKDEHHSWSKGALLAARTRAYDHIRPSPERHPALGSLLEAASHHCLQGATLLALQRAPWLAGFRGPRAAEGGRGGAGGPPAQYLLGRAVLHRALRSGHEQVFAWAACRAALELGAVAGSHLFEGGGKGGTGQPSALWVAAAAGRPVLMQAMVALGLDPRIPGPNGLTPMAALAAGNQPDCLLPDENIAVCIRYLSLFPHWRAPSVVCGSHGGPSPLELAASRLGANTMLALLALPPVAAGAVRGDGTSPALDAVNARDTAAAAALSQLCRQITALLRPRQKGNRLSMQETTLRQVTEPASLLSDVPPGGERPEEEQEALDLRVLQATQRVWTAHLSNNFLPTDRGGHRMRPFDDFRPPRPQAGFMKGTRRHTDTPFGLQFPAGLRLLMPYAWLQRLSQGRAAEAPGRRGAGPNPLGKGEASSGAGSSPAGTGSEGTGRAGAPLLYVQNHAHTLLGVAATARAHREAADAMRADSASRGPAPPSGGGGGEDGTPHPDGKAAMQEAVKTKKKRKRGPPVPPATAAASLDAEKDVGNYVATAAGVKWLQQQGHGGVAFSDGRGYHTMEELVAEDTTGHLRAALRGCEKQGEKLRAALSIEAREACRAVRGDLQAADLRGRLPPVDSRSERASDGTSAAAAGEEALRREIGGKLYVAVSASGAFSHHLVRGGGAAAPWAASGGGAPTAAGDDEESGGRAGDAAGGGPALPAWTSLQGREARVMVEEDVDPTLGASKTALARAGAALSLRAPGGELELQAAVFPVWMFESRDGGMLDAARDPDAEPGQHATIPAELEADLRSPQKFISTPAGDTFVQRCIQTLTRLTHQRASAAVCRALLRYPIREARAAQEAKAARLAASVGAVPGTASGGGGIAPTAEGGGKRKRKKAKAAAGPARKPADGPSLPASPAVTPSSAAAVDAPPGQATDSRTAEEDAMKSGQRRREQKRPLYAGGAAVAAYRPVRTGGPGLRERKGRIGSRGGEDVPLREPRSTSEEARELQKALQESRRGADGASSRHTGGGKGAGTSSNRTQDDGGEGWHRVGEPKRQLRSSGGGAAGGNGARRGAGNGRRARGRSGEVESRYSGRAERSRGAAVVHSDRPGGSRRAGSDTAGAEGSQQPTGRTGAQSLSPMAAASGMLKKAVTISAVPSPVASGPASVWKGKVAAAAKAKGKRGQAVAPGSSNGRAARGPARKQSGDAGKPRDGPAAAGGASAKAAVPAASGTATAAPYFPALGQGTANSRSAGASPSSDTEAGTDSQPAAEPTEAPIASDVADSNAAPEESAALTPAAPLLVAPPTVRYDSTGSAPTPVIGLDKSLSARGSGGPSAPGSSNGSSLGPADGLLRASSAPADVGEPPADSPLATPQTSGPSADGAETPYSSKGWAAAAHHAAEARAKEYPAVPRAPVLARTPSAVAASAHVEEDDVARLRGVVWEQFPEAEAASVSVRHLLGLDLDSLSAGQLDVVQRVCQDVERRVGEAKLRVVVRSGQMAMAAELRAIERRMEEGYAKAADSEGQSEKKEARAKDAQEQGRGVEGGAGEETKEDGEAGEKVAAAQLAPERQAYEQQEPLTSGPQPHPQASAHMHAQAHAQAVAVAQAMAQPRSQAMGQPVPQGYPAPWQQAPPPPVMYSGGGAQYPGMYVGPQDMYGMVPGGMYMNSMGGMGMGGMMPHPGMMGARPAGPFSAMPSLAPGPMGHAVLPTVPVGGYGPYHGGGSPGGGGSGRGRGGGSRSTGGRGKSGGSGGKGGGNGGAGARPGGKGEKSGTPRGHKSKKRKGGAAVQPLREQQQQEVQAQAAVQHFMAAQLLRQQQEAAERARADATAAAVDAAGPRPAAAGGDMPGVASRPIASTAGGGGGADYLTTGGESS